MLTIETRSAGFRIAGSSGTATHHPLCTA
jgi:hypothetical protein